MFHSLSFVTNNLVLKWKLKVTQLHSSGSSPFFVHLKTSQKAKRLCYFDFGLPQRKKNIYFSPSLSPKNSPLKTLCFLKPSKRLTDYATLGSTKKPKRKVPPRHESTITERNSTNKMMINHNKQSNKESGIKKTHTPTLEYY
eukprot:GILJ01032158.1.p1 GENE.GILJ01032158.1~~GILJ01032158.1.p1  ORF type:complete len:142 (-),score=7.54 GILJ01032158.1:91-516(-)